MTVTPTAASSRWKAVACGLLFLLVGLVVWDGADRRAVDASRPMAQSPSAAVQQASPQSLKLGSFNIHSGKGVDGVRDLSRTAALLSDLDFVGLYEVRSMSDARQPNQAAALGSRIESSWLFAPTERQWWSDHFGNGLLYRIPLHSVVRIPLVNTRGKAYRNAVLSSIDLQGKTVQILSVHIDREADRRHQLQTVIDLFMGLQEPCVLMGDLNTIAADPLLMSLRDRKGVHSPLHDSMEGGPPSQTIDWIFTRGLKTVAAELVKNDASDHPFLRGEFVPQVDE